MKHIPIVATLVVALAVAAMIALGVWQLQRAQWKDALIARYATAKSQPGVTFPIGTVNQDLLFRRSSVVCLQLVGWTVSAGRNQAGQSGWRHLAACRTGAEGPGATIDIGWTPGFDTKPVWSGGRVSGTIGPKPDHRSLIGMLFGAAHDPGVLLVSDTAAPGLQPSLPPSLEDIPNNHRAYAVQWFVFAGLAVLIYGLALGRRMRMVR
jgi:surfeit locus 1 family protein